jgi:hypothetical protein
MHERSDHRTAPSAHWPFDPGHPGRVAGSNERSVHASAGALPGPRDLSPSCQTLPVSSLFRYPHLPLLGPDSDGGPRLTPLTALAIAQHLPVSSLPIRENGSLLTAPSAKMPSRDILFQRADRALKPAERGHFR